MVEEKFQWMPSVPVNQKKPNYIVLEISNYLKLTLQKLSRRAELNRALNLKILVGDN